MYVTIKVARTIHAQILIAQVHRIKTTDAQKQLPQVQKQTLKTLTE